MKLFTAFKCTLSVLVLFCFYFSSTSIAQTHIDSAYQNREWDDPNGYILDEDVTIDDDDLVIDATEIDFDGYTLTIDGVDLRVGQTDDVVISNSGGISILGDGNQTINIQYLDYYGDGDIAEGTDEGISVNGIIDLNIRYCNFEDVSCVNRAVLQLMCCTGFDIDDCHFEDYWKTGVMFRSGVNPWVGNYIDGEVKNCTFQPYQGGVQNGTAIFFSTGVQNTNNHSVDIFGCRIINSPHGIVLYNVPSNGTYDFYNNIVSGGGVGIEFINCSSNTTVRNNVIYGVTTSVFPNTGTGIFCTQGITNAKIHNNIVFGCEESGIYGRYGNAAQIINNISWDNDGSGYDFYDNIDIRNFDFRNNIAGNNDEYGVYVAMDPGLGSVHHTAFKGNSLGDINTNENRLNDDCIFHEDNELFYLKDETPSSNDWDFRTSMPNIVNQDYNIFTVFDNDGNPTGYDFNGTWKDPDFSSPNFGAFGGPYADNNIDPDFNTLKDYIMVLDLDWLDMNAIRVEYYKLAWEFQQGEIDVQQQIAAGTTIESEGVLIYSDEIIANGDSGDDVISFVFSDGAYLKFTSTLDIAASYLVFSPIII